MKEEIEQQLTRQREDLSAVEQKLGTPSRAESTLALRSIQLAAMWLGRCLGALGNRTPYKEAFDPNSAVVEERADQAEKDAEDEKKSSKKEDEIKRVKELRVSLNKLEMDLWQNVRGYEDRQKYQVYAHEAYKEVCKATMFLGLVLNAMKLETGSDEFLTEPTKVIPDGEPVPQDARLELMPTTDKKIIEHQKKAEEHQRASQKAMSQPKTGETKMSPNPGTKNSKHGR